MFKHIFKYWHNVTDSPALVSKINLWSYVNVRVFKFKLSNALSYFILGLANLSQKEIKVLHKDVTFEKLYLFFVLYLILFVFILFFFI